MKHLSIKITIIVLLLLSIVCGIMISGDWQCGLPAGVLLDFRCNRIFAALLVGGSLSLAGMLFQQIFANVLVSPYTLGISSGASVGCALVFLLGLQHLVWSVNIGAFAGAVLTLLLVLMISGGGRGSGNRLLLSGVIVATVISSLLVYIISVADVRELAGISFWMLGDLQAVNRQALVFAAVAAVIFIAVARYLANDLNAMALGDEWALSLGVRVRMVRVVILVVSALMVSVCVSLAGVIGFVGLIVPHSVRIMLKNNIRETLIWHFLAGSLFLTVCDFFCCRIDPVRQIPVGVITSFAGGICFCILLNLYRSKTP